MILAQPDIETKRRIDTALRVLPPGWVQRVEKARDNIAWTLQTLSANALELSALWLGQGFHQKLLVDVASNTFKSRLPMEASDFEAHQQECHERVKSTLWTHWLPKSAEIFRLIPPVCINGDAEAYYRSIATLQGNQLRRLVQDSLDAFVKFFESYRGTARDTLAENAVMKIVTLMLVKYSAWACRSLYPILVCKSAHDPHMWCFSHPDVCNLTYSGWVTFGSEQCVLLRC